MKQYNHKIIVYIYIYKLTAVHNTHIALKPMTIIRLD